MELREIEQLIKKYETGETNLAEEKVLREYFSGANVSEHIVAYKILFAYTETAKKQTYNAESNLPKKKKTYGWSVAAAVIILALGVFLYQNNPIQIRDTEMGNLANSEADLEKTREAMQMVSDIMKEGSEDLLYIKEFNNTKNKFLLDN